MAELPQRLFRRKPLERILAEPAEAIHTLKRTLSAFDLTMLGVGAIIGAGIFALVGTAAAGDPNRLGAGPALTLSFLLTAAACGLSALCYAEFASLIPIAGSAYTYSYATLGELIAWIIGWDLILEYMVGNVAVAVSWSSYFMNLVEGLGIDFPIWLATDVRTALRTPEILDAAPRVAGIPIIVNLPAAFICFALTVILVIGIKESSRFNTAMVLLKIGILLLFVLLGAFYVKPDNWHPFAPNGWAGISAGAAIIFFAYIGFDAISTAAEEAKEPQRTMPIGIIASLIICTILYMITAAVLTGMVPWTQLGVPDPLALAFDRIGVHWAAGVVSFGAVVATTAVLLVFQMGQPRIFFSMARDGLLPSFFARVHPRFRTPHLSTILVGTLTGLVAAFEGLAEMADLTSIGTLFAFVLVCIGVIVLRRTDPGRTRPFRTPLVPWVPIAGALACLYLMWNLPHSAKWRFVVWLVLGLVFYFLYGFRKSRWRQEVQSP
jgi:APA family basic amino acid/polyamine antiporter